MGHRSQSWAHNGSVQHVGVGRVFVEPFLEATFACHRGNEIRWGSGAGRAVEGGVLGLQVNGINSGG